MSAWQTWQPVPLSPRHRVSVYRTPVSYFAERVRRLRFFSYARLDASFWQARQALCLGAAHLPAARAALVGELVGRLETLPALDPDLFVATHHDPGPALPAGAEDDLLAAMDRTLPPGYVAQDGELFRRATLDATIRALYDALRPLPVVAVGPEWLIDLSARLRLPRFSLVVAPDAEPEAARQELLARLVEGHAAWHGAPVAYVFRADLLSPWLVLELHGRLRNAFLLDLGPVLDVCVPERVLAASWGRIHWRAIASHLGLDGHRARHTRRRAPAALPLPGPRPADAPARRRERVAPGVERRRRAPFAPFEHDAAPAEPDAAPERLAPGDLQRCLSDVLERATGD